VCVYSTGKYDGAAAQIDRQQITVLQNEVFSTLILVLLFLYFFLSFRIYFCQVGGIVHHSIFIPHILCMLYASSLNFIYIFAGYQVRGIIVH
jgi:hypothetical protein